MRFLLLVIFLIMPCTIQAQIYKWVDDQGIVNYSDTPHSGASTIDLPTMQTYPTPGGTANTDNADPNAKTAATDSQTVTAATAKNNFTVYKSITIQQPEDNGTVRDNQGLVNINVILDPELQAGHALRALLDGAPTGQAVQATTFNITGVDRGAHKLQVQIIGNNGSVLKSSPAITFYMHHAGQTPAQKVNPLPLPVTPAEKR